MDVNNIIIGVVAGVPALAAAWFAYRSSVRASEVTAQTNEIARTKVDAEAYERSQQFYEKVLAEADRQIERLRTQVERLNDQLDRLNDQLAKEQDVSNTLRSQVRALTNQIGAMESTVEQLHERLGDRPHNRRKDDNQ